MKTEELIQSLANDAPAVSRLRHPAVRAMMWMVGSLIYMATLVWLIGPRADLSERLADTRFIVEIGATFLTSLFAAAAAFCAGCPGRPIWERFAPFPFLAIWLASLGEGCWQQWVQHGSGSLSLGVDLVCFQAIFLVSLMPALAILFMVRQGAPLAPMSTVGLATLSATALGAATLRFFHLQDVGLMLVVWQFGSVIILTFVGFLIGRWLLRWSHSKVSTLDSA